MNWLRYLAPGFALLITASLCMQLLRSMRSHEPEAPQNTIFVVPARTRRLALCGGIIGSVALAVWWYFYFG